MPPITTTAENNGDDVGAHPRADLIDRRGQDAGEGRERHTETIGQRDHARHIDTKGADHGRIFGRGPQVGAELRLFNHEPGPEQTTTEATITHPR